MKIEPQPRATLTFSAEVNSENCECEACKRSKKFDAPSELLDLIIDGKVVLFAGGGVSTEGNGVMPNTFFREISRIVGSTDLSRSFPDVMEEYCSLPSGKVGLIQRIKGYFDYAYAHASIYSDATRFHRELATFFPIDTIVTTNWDSYFEDICAAIPFIEDRDIALWDVADRKVLKIHGSISNFGSIVATRTDYDACSARLSTGLLGAHLKSLLATRSTIFIGYSLKDDDFIQVYNSVRSALDGFHRQAYFIAPNIDEVDRVRLKSMNLHVIETDGTFFLSQIKKYASTKRCISSDQMYEDVAELSLVLSHAHDWLHDRYNAVKYPQILFCSWYQDGMEHALSRILRLKRTGVYSDIHRTTHSFRSYLKYAEGFKKLKRYQDAAYCYGYANAYLYASLSDEDRAAMLPPLFFYFGCEISTATQYRRALKFLPDQHKAAFKYAQKVVKDKPFLASHILHHTDQLNLSLVR